MAALEHVLIGIYCLIELSYGGVRFADGHSQLASQCQILFSVIFKTGV